MPGARVCAGGTQGAAQVSPQVSRPNQSSPTHSSHTKTYNLMQGKLRRGLGGRVACRNTSRGGGGCAAAQTSRLTQLKWGASEWGVGRTCMCGRGLAARHRSPGKTKPSGQGRARERQGAGKGPCGGGGVNGRRRDALEPARKQQEKIPRFLKNTQTSLPRSGRDKERGTAPHNKLEARRASVGGGLHPRPS